MTNYTDILSEDFELPDIVKVKMENAFDTIRTEDRMATSNKKQNHTKRTKSFRHATIAAACICLLLVGSTTVYAAYQYFWGRGMQGTLQATTDQQQTLINSGMATVFESKEQFSDIAVTENGVTVTPKTLIVNEKLLYLSLSVDGYQLKAGEAPCFKSIDVHLGDNPDTKDSWINVLGASFYDGIIPDKDGTNMYDDGTPLQYDENGSLIFHYTDEDGTMEYIITAMVSVANDNLLGETLHINLTNLGTVKKAEYTDNLTGNWNFTIPLPETSSMELYHVNQAVEGTTCVVDSVELSPVAIKINYALSEKIVLQEDEDAVPQFHGVIYKDGTEIPYLKNGGMFGFTDETCQNAYDIHAFNRVIQPEQVAGILLRTESGYRIVNIDS